MPQSPGRIAAGLLLLVGVWIGVYWWWEPSRPKITFPEPDASAKDVGAGDPKAAEPLVTEPSPAPPPEARPTPPVVTPAAEPKPKSAVIPPEFVEYTARQGDTLASISQKFFGTPGKADAIARMNPLLSPPDLKAGRVIKVPKDPGNIQGKPAPHEPSAVPPKPTPAAGGAAQSHTVVKNDTLSGIAKKYYGSAHPRFIDKLLDANKGVISAPEDLRPGQTLRIPAKE